MGRRLQLSLIEAIGQQPALAASLSTTMREVEVTTFKTLGSKGAQGVPKVLYLEFTDLENAKSNM